MLAGASLWVYLQKRFLFISYKIFALHKLTGSFFSKSYTGLILNLSFNKNIYFWLKQKDG